MAIRRSKHLKEDVKSATSECSSSRERSHSVVKEPKGPFNFHDDQRGFIVVPTYSRTTLQEQTLAWKLQRTTMLLWGSPTGIVQ
eukprot:6432068-Amphidinium_carterae.1